MIKQKLIRKDNVILTTGNIIYGNMCGICGFIDNEKYNFDLVISDMLDSIKYRGPNHSGTKVINCLDKKIMLGHNRLSILDLSSMGNQPMSSEDDRVTISYNGEIYNYKDIRKELIARGYSFKSNCDTEVILYAYIEWGITFIQKLNGMFAIAIFDEREESLYLIRDRMGIKPLYYYSDNGTLIFSSELKPIMVHPNFKKEINKKSLNSYLFHQYITGDQTIFNHTFKVKPGCYVKIKNNLIEKKQYWSIKEKYSESTIDDLRTEKDYIRCLDEKITEAVKYRMVSDVPIGAFLSGGVDSSLVSAIMQNLSKNKINTFSIGFYENKYNEAQYAKEVAKHIGSNHYEKYISMNEAKELIYDIPKYYDEPFADSSQIPTMLVSMIAKEKVTVCLSGDGGDELFCGYGRYERVVRLQKYKNIARIMNVVDFNKFIRKNLVYKNYLGAKLLELNTNPRIINSSYYTFEHIISRLLNEDYYIDKAHEEGCISTDNIQLMHMLYDMQTYLPDDILTKVDRASMKYSLEARTPLLDHNIVEYSFKIPHELKYNNNTSKYILKEVLYKYVPKQLIDRPKMGFGIPLTEWLMNDFHFLIEKYTEYNYIQEQGIFNYSELLRIKKMFYNGNGYITNMIWAILVFQMWYEEYIN